MRKIVHLSDIHFGRIDSKVKAGLVRDVQAVAPDLLVVSGDLTQRARTGQFKRARAFLDRFSCPKLVVPGNHDIPVFDLPRRFLSPLARFRRFITDDLSPVYRDPEVAIFGINSTRRFPFVMGRISEAQVRDVCDRIKALPANAFRAVVAHHPFLAPPPEGSLKIVGRAEEALALFAGCGVQLILAGHVHQGYAGLPVREDRILIIQASTVSDRTRGEPNAYNLIVLDPVNPPRLDLTRRAWNGDSFEAAFRETWIIRDGRWVRQ